MKWILVFGLLVAGIVFLVTGVGGTIPLVKYKGIEGYGIPVGVVLLAAAIALARFWRITTERTETTSSDEHGRFKRVVQTTIRTFKGPDLN